MEQFTIMAKSVHGAACGQLIQDATNSKACYTFSALLAEPNVAQLKHDAALSKYHRLLELFAYGTYADYKNASSEYPALSTVQLFKLRQLSIVSMALRQRSIEYTALMAALELDSTLELENLIIDAMDHGLFSCKLDQKNGRLVIRELKGRDAQVPADAAKVAQQLDAWLGGAQTVLDRIDDIIQRLQESDRSTAKMQEEFDAKVQEMIKLIEEKKELGKDEQHQQQHQQEAKEQQRAARDKKMGKRLRK